ncbi:hypothetical protein CTEN210_12494 [Chaetoceros tenuissimus]|uniref:RING-type E3 ubiquitin transferase n=1 Tax=Chaetoceros tenuissimus TaxID=426638 RepID=A0AAD3D1E3_9STRA|nr:hypothetical protein CTEN210_12494 [Chaetoceros tenuissimus]
MSAPMDALCKEAAKLKLEGNDLYKAKKYKEAASKYRLAIDKDQCNAVYYTNLCVTLNQLKLYEEMNAVASKCISIDENSVKGHYWLIMSLKKQKKYKEAFVQCDVSREKFPVNADIKLLQTEIGMKVKRCAHENCPVPVTSQVDLFKCSGCIDNRSTYYCSRDCQKSDWSRHKYTCKSGPKQSRCSLCQKMFDYEREFRCEICNSMSYCSINCREQDKERHERVTCVVSFKELELFDKWFETERANESLGEFATHAMSKEEFLSQDREFFVLITLRFSGRHCSFVPIKPPRVLYKADMNPTQIEDMKQQINFRKSLGPLQLGHLLCVTFVRGDVVQDKTFYGKYRLQIYCRSKSYQMLPFEDAMTSNFNHVNCGDNPIVPPAWKKIQSNYPNYLRKWAVDAQKSGILVDFVLASYQHKSKPSYQSAKEYTIVINYEFGERLGEIKQLRCHRFMKISGIKNSSLIDAIKVSIKDYASNKNHVEFSLTMICNNSGSGVVTVLPVKISKKQMKAFQKRKSCDDEVMEKLWQDLLKVPFQKGPPTPKYPDF